MAALVAAIHDCPPKRQRCGVDARDERGHDGGAGGKTTAMPYIRSRRPKAGGILSRMRTAPFKNGAGGHPVGRIGHVTFGAAGERHMRLHERAGLGRGAPAFPPSWPRSSRPSTTARPSAGVCDVDARDEREHDGLPQDRTAPRPDCAKTGHAPRSDMPQGQGQGRQSYLFGTGPSTFGTATTFGATMRTRVRTPSGRVTSCVGPSC